MSEIEIIDSAEFAVRVCVPESWVRDQVRSRATDPIPHLRFGRYVRFQWGHPDLIAWLERRRSNNRSPNRGSAQVIHRTKKPAAHE